MTTATATRTPLSLVTEAPAKSAKPATRPNNRVLTTADMRAYQADVQTDDQQAAYVTALETQADEFVHGVSDLNVQLAGVLADLFTYRAWEVHDVEPADYWTNFRGISADTMSLTYAGRRELVKLTPAATVAEHRMMTGASKATIMRDRAEFGIGNPAKRDSQKGKHAPDSPADDNAPDSPETSPGQSADDNAPDSPADSPTSPAKPTGSTRTSQLTDDELAQLTDLLKRATLAQTLGALTASGHKDVSAAYAARKLTRETSTASNGR